MTVLSRYRLELTTGVAVICLVAAAVFAGHAGLGLADLRGGEATIRASQARAAALNTPPPPARARPLVAGRAATLQPRVGELLNVRLGELGLAVSSVDTIARRPFAPGLDALSVTVRGRGETAGGLKALAWFEANRDAIAVENVQALPADSGGDWTFKLVVLVAPSPATVETAS